MDVIWEVDWRERPRKGVQGKEEAAFPVTPAELMEVWSHRAVTIQREEQAGERSSESGIPLTQWPP